MSNISSLLLSRNIISTALWLLYYFTLLASTSICTSVLQIIVLIVTNYAYRHTWHNISQKGIDLPKTPNIELEMSRLVLVKHVQNKKKLFFVFVILFMVKFMEKWYQMSKIFFRKESVIGSALPISTFKIRFLATKLL